MPEMLNDDLLFAPSDMQLTSPAFTRGGDFPQKYTQDGEGVSPPLAWDNVPEQTKSFVVFAHDPDAPCVSRDGSYGFTHWALYNLPSSTTALDEGTKLGAAGKNSRGGLDYIGPSPPSGHGIHLYYFWVLALDAELNLEAGLTLTQLLQAIQPNILGMSRLVGGYQRS